MNEWKQSFQTARQKAILDKQIYVDACVKFWFPIFKAEIDRACKHGEFYAFVYETNSTLPCELASSKHRLFGMGCAAEEFASKHKGLSVEQDFDYRSIKFSGWSQ